VPSWSILNIRIVPVVSFVFLTLVSDEHNIGLVWTAVRPLLVICLSPSDTCSSRWSTILV
jgi:hypothetical protein